MSETKDSKSNSKSRWPNRPSMDEWQLYCSRNGGQEACEALLPKTTDEMHERERRDVYSQQYIMREKLIEEDKNSSPKAKAAYAFEAVYDSLMDQDEYYLSSLFWELHARGLFPREPSEYYAQFSDEDLLDLWEIKNSASAE